MGNGDRWHNSGGKAGARDMPINVIDAAGLRVRRRYGSVTKRGAINWRFHEYSLVRRVVRSDPPTSNARVVDVTPCPAAVAAGTSEQPAAICEEWVEDRT